MSITNRISACHPALVSIPADLLHTATGGASPVLPNGEPNGVLVGGPAPVSPPQPPAWTYQGDVFAREKAQAELQQWVDNAGLFADLKKGGWFDLGRPH